MVVGFTVTDKEPIPWSIVEKEIVKATRRLPCTRFVNVKDIAREIMGNPGKYPATTGASKWHPGNRVTDRTIRMQVIVALKNMQWVAWNGGKARATGRVFLVPWVPEDPVIVRIREGRAVKH